MPLTRVKVTNESFLRKDSYSNMVFANETNHCVLDKTSRFRPFFDQVGFASVVDF